MRRPHDRLVAPIRIVAKVPSPVNRTETFLIRDRVAPERSIISGPVKIATDKQQRDFVIRSAFSRARFPPQEYRTVYPVSRDYRGIAQFIRRLLCSLCLSLPLSCSVDNRRRAPRKFRARRYFDDVSRL